jgi:phage major head subunit gpT-like protein
MASDYSYNGPQAGVSFDSLPGQFTAFRAAFDEEMAASLSFDISPFVLPQNLNGGLTLDLETIRGIAIMKRWAGSKVVEDALAGFSNIIKTIPWEATETIQRREYNANPNGLGLVTSKIAGLADEAAQHTLRMFAATLEANAASAATLTTLGLESDFVSYLAGLKCLDGKALFATDHPLANGKTYSNISTSGHNTASLTAALVAMKKIPEWLHGRRIDNRPTFVMTPVDLTPRYKQLIESELDPDQANNADNPNRNAVQVVENPFLLDTDKVYLINTRRAQMKPIVHAFTNPAHLVQQTDPQSDSVFDRGAYKFGAESDGYVMVPGHAFTAYRIASS